MRTKFARSEANDDPSTALNLSEIGADLAAEANFYMTATNDLPDMTGAEMALQLSKMLDADTIRFFLESGEIGRGILIGIAVGVEALEQAVDIKLVGLEELYGSEEDVPDDLIEEEIITGLKQGLHGGKKGENDEEH